VRIGGAPARAAEGARWIAVSLRLTREVVERFGVVYF
jgi:hypothetical protein